MWARDLLFVGLVGGGAVALFAGLFPSRIPGRSAVREVAPPPPEYQAVVEQINARFRQQWREKGVSPAPAAPELGVARRLSLALMGTTPSLQEIRRFEAWPEGQRLSAWLEHILRDRRFGDYVAERLARSYVGTEDGPFLVYRRRRFVSWLSDQLLERRPYDDLVRELISADGLWTEKPATNFVTVTIANDKPPDPERLGARVSRAFLGLRLDCAQCHDHKFQPWKQKDFQGLAAYFGQARTGFTGLYDNQQTEFKVENKKTKQPEVVSPQVPFLPELVPSETDRRVQLARWVTHPKNPYFARATANRMWGLLFGRPLVEPVDDIVSQGEPPPVLQLLAADFVDHGFDVHRLIRVIAATEVFQRDSAVEPEVTDLHEQEWASFPLVRLRPEQVVGGIQQAASLKTLNGDSNIIVRITRAVGENEFVKRYGDMGEDEFHREPGTIPQRLLMMNGNLVQERIKESILNAATRIAMLAPNDRIAVETCFLVLLTRRPTPQEAAHFENRLAEAGKNHRNQCLSDLYWTLINSTEFSWNH